MKYKIRNKIIVFSLIFLFGCKSNFGFSGTYKTEVNSDTIQNNYTFNFQNNEYRQYYKNATCGVLYSKGHFKMLKLTDEKFLLVCNDIILEKENPNEKIDTITDNPEYYFRDRIRSHTVFELTLTKYDSLHFRLTTTNKLGKTFGMGYLICKK